MTITCSYKTLHKLALLESATRQSCHTTARCATTDYKQKSERLDNNSKDIYLVLAYNAVVIEQAVWSVSLSLCLLHKTSWQTPDLQLLSRNISVPWTKRHYGGYTSSLMNNNHYYDEPKRPSYMSEVGHTSTDKSTAVARLEGCITEVGHGYRQTVWSWMQIRRNCSGLDPSSKYGLASFGSNRPSL